MFSLKASKIISELSVYAETVFKCSVCFVKKQNKQKNLLVSLKTLGINSNNGSESHKKFLFSLSFLRSHWPQLSEQFSGLRGFPESRNKLPEEDFWKNFHNYRVVRDFIEYSRNYTLDFFTKRQPTIVKTINAHLKST
jgi:hypothetical protein